jgi:TolA-binding protein
MSWAEIIRQAGTGQRALMALFAVVLFVLAITLFKKRKMGWSPLVVFLLVVLSLFLYARYGTDGEKHVAATPYSQAPGGGQRAAEPVANPAASPKTRFEETGSALNNQSADALYNGAVALMRAAKHAEAAMKFGEFLNTHPTHASAALAQYNLAVCYQNLAVAETGTNSLHLAEKEFTEFLKKHSTHPNAAKAQANLEKVRVALQERQMK